MWRVVCLIAWSSETTATSLCVTVVGQDAGRRGERQGSKTSEGSRSEMLAGEASL